MKNVFMPFVILFFVSIASTLHATPPDSPHLPAGTIYNRTGEPVAAEEIGKEKALCCYC